ncbi:hypothetical protein [Lysobacter enzymogenes]|uniref:hypothetical protein n=1 Tax=Lysobacter enzymogenes TaxID=69 RepID=UPI001A978614|nr:hypothetical protein [Lysobacter enzymogenes]QQP97938.1 hypothetical protein JHW38_08025 [Lysobacter enzymogenes]
MNEPSQSGFGNESASPAIQRAAIAHSAAPGPVDRLSFLRSTAPVRATRDSTLVPLNLEEGAVAPHAQMLEFGEWEDPEGMAADADVTVMRDIHGKALAYMTVILGTIKQVRDDDDPSLNDAGRLKVLAKVVEPKLESFAVEVGKEFKRIDESIAQERAAIVQEVRPTDPYDIAMQAEIRSHFAALPDNKRNAEMTKVLLGQDLDTATLQALALAPAYLSNLLPSQHERAHAALAKRLAPERVKRIEALQASKQRAGKALGALDKYANQLIDFKKARGLIERENKRSGA